MRAHPVLAALAAAAIAVSACAAAGRPVPDAKSDLGERASKPCPEHRKVGDGCRPRFDVNDPVFWIALPFAAALIVTAPLWLPHVMFK